MTHLVPQRSSADQYIVFVQHRADVSAGICIATHFDRKSDRYHEPLVLKRHSSPSSDAPQPAVFTRMKYATEQLFDSPEFRAESYAIVAINNDDRDAVMLVKGYMESLACSSGIVMANIKVVKTVHLQPSQLQPVQQFAFEEYFAAA